MPRQAIWYIKKSLQGFTNNYSSNFEVYTTSQNSQKYEYATDKEQVRKEHKKVELFSIEIVLIVINLNSHANETPYIRGILAAVLRNTTN